MTENDGYLHETSREIGSMIATPGDFRKSGGRGRRSVAAISRPRLGCFPEADRDFVPSEAGIGPMAPAPARP